MIGVLLLALGPHGQEFALERRPVGAWQVRFRGEASQFKGAVVYPVPPNDPGQDVKSCRLIVTVNGKTVDGKRVADKSPLAQPVLQVLVEAPSDIRVEAIVDAQFYEVRLVRGKGSKATLSDAERKVYLDCRWQKKEHEQWFRDHVDKVGMTKSAQEDEAAFIVRVLQYMAREYTYRIPDELPEYKRLVAEHGNHGNWLHTVSTKSGECWRLSEVFANIVRMSGIPVRVVSGNLVGPKSGHHVRTLVFLAGSGWVPVEPTNAVVVRNGARYFGSWSDGGTLLNGNVNLWVQMPTAKGAFTVGTADWPWIVPERGEATPVKTYSCSRL